MAAASIEGFKLAEDAVVAKVPLFSAAVVHEIENGIAALDKGDADGGKTDGDADVKVAARVPHKVALLSQLVGKTIDLDGSLSFHVEHVQTG